MRRLLSLVLVLVMASPSWAAVSVTSANAGTDTCYAASTTCVVTIAAAAGDTVCLATDLDQSNRTMSVTDSASNVYTQIATAEIAVTKEGWIFCYINLPGSITSVTATASSTIAGNAHAVAWVVTGARTSAYTPNSSSNTQTGTSHTTNAVTYGGTNNSAFLGFSAHSGTAGETIDATFTSSYSGTGGVFGYRLNSANTTMTNTTAGSRSSVAMMVEIQEATGGASVNFFPRRLQENP